MTGGSTQFCHNAITFELWGFHEAQRSEIPARTICYVYISNHSYIELNNILQILSSPSFSQLPPYMLARLGPYSYNSCLVTLYQTGNISFCSSISSRVNIKSNSFGLARTCRTACVQSYDLTRGYSRGVSLIVSTRYFGCWQLLKP